MNTAINYYSMLDIERSATFEQIRTAYRMLMLRQHPDKGGDTTVSQQINAAYAVLSDPQRRQSYDRLLEEQRQARIKSQQQRAEATANKRHEQQSRSMMSSDFSPPPPPPSSINKRRKPSMDIPPPPPRRYNRPPDWNRRTSFRSYRQSLDSDYSIYKELCRMQEELIKTMSK